MDWSKLPDIVAVALLAWAFASVARRGEMRGSGAWLIAWLLIVVHFVAFLFLPYPRSAVSDLAAVVGEAALAGAGLLFIWASVPFRNRPSSRFLLGALMALSTAYIAAVCYEAPRWVLDFIAVLSGAIPLVVVVGELKRFKALLRWVMVGLSSCLAVFLIVVDHTPNIDLGIGLNGLFFTIYLSCTIYFIYRYRRATAGSIISICGFLAWSAVFVVSPVQEIYFPNVRIEDEVWNLPKYVVAVGMILLLLEEQIEYNRHLALHDVLTGLPNRRLFQDRLSSALERARRSNSQVALLVLDLNRFKEVNDTRGHHVGDLLLQSVAQLFAGRVRKSDTVARTGGDEFSIILEGPASRLEAEHVGQSLLALLRAPLQLETQLVKIGASLGLALFPDDASDAEALFVEADQRMYEHKRSDEPKGVEMPSLR